MTHYKPGDRFFVSKPYALAIGDHVRTKLCAFCLRANPNLQRCSQCQFLFYCSAECQKADWVDHRFECQNIRRSAPKVPKEPARLLCRALLKWKRENAKEMQTRETILGEIRYFRTLVDHKDAIKMDRKRCHEFLEMLNLIRVFLSKPQSEGIKDTDILEFYGKMCVNGMQVQGDCGPLGSGIYLGASAIDHSCYPNMNVIYEGRNLIVQCIRPVTVNSISDVSVYYIPLFQSKQARKVNLETLYYFTCNCPMCSGEVAEMVTESDPALTEKVMEIRDLLVDDSSKDNPKKALAAIEAMLENELKDLPASDAAKGSALQVAADGCVALEIYDRACNYYRELMPSIRRLYTEYSGWYAHFMLRVARILKILLRRSPDDVQVEKVTKVLQETLKVCKVALGEDNFHTRDVILLLKEMEMMKKQTEVGGGERPSVSA